MPADIQFERRDIESVRQTWAGDTLLGLMHKPHKWSFL